MRIMIVGGGSLGLLFAARLAAYCKDLTLVTRTSEQALVLAMDGISLLENERQEQLNVKGFTCCSYIDITSTKKASDIGPVDYLFLMVKQTAITAELIEVCQAFMSPATYLVSFQNGVGHERKLSQAMGADRLLLAVTTEGAKRSGLAAVNHTGHGITYLGVVLGQDDMFEKNQHQLLVELLELAGFRAEMSKNMEVRVWSKLAINAVINPLTAVLRMRNGELLDSPWTRSLMQDLYQEVHLLAAAQGIRLPDQLWDNILAVCKATSHNHSSMLQDVEALRHTEVDYMNGSLLQQAKELHLELPTHSFIYRMIKALEK